ncbi:uncharacterized protein H6S33_011055 [Morchella sextelata]|uniref:uncharacterized protein n=1 Tax=Morchella sextelata TaxID=1174677 RepID=UPI001D047F81|nr:uncharacterized protein H6S33_011055 [Morchella sextelata]KAH0611790.1 hypothetical protein H6S33_011055 [Morchella sextelata]
MVNKTIKITPPQANNPGNDSKFSCINSRIPVARPICPEIVSGVPPRKVFEQSLFKQRRKQSGTSRGEMKEEDTIGIDIWNDDDTRQGVESTDSEGMSSTMGKTSLWWNQKKNMRYC